MVISWDLTTINGDVVWFSRDPLCWFNIVFWKSPFWLGKSPDQWALSHSDPLEGYAFHCRCPACTDRNAASDARRKRLGEVVQDLNRGAATVAQGRGWHTMAALWKTKMVFSPLGEWSTVMGFTLMFVYGKGRCQDVRWWRFCIWGGDDPLKCWDVRRCNHGVSGCLKSTSIWSVHQEWMVGTEWNGDRSQRLWPRLAWSKIGSPTRVGNVKIWLQQESSTLEMSQDRPICEWDECHENKTSVVKCHGKPSTATSHEPATVAASLWPNGGFTWFYHIKQSWMARLRLSKKWYPLVNIQKNIEHGPIEIVDLPIHHGGSFHRFIVFCMFTRG
jgi:hypothetical protein